jgi:hypothetical protein
MQELHRFNCQVVKPLARIIQNQMVNTHGCIGIGSADISILGLWTYSDLFRYDIQTSYRWTQTVHSGHATRAQFAKHCMSESGRKCLQIQEDTQFNAELFKRGLSPDSLHVDGWKGPIRHALQVLMVSGALTLRCALSLLSENYEGEDAWLQAQAFFEDVKAGFKSVVCLPGNLDEAAEPAWQGLEPDIVGSFAYENTYTVYTCYLGQNPPTPPKTSRWKRWFKSR